MGRASAYRLLGAAILLCCTATHASAQYFGRNKVQYDRDHVRVLATEHFDVYFSREDAEAAHLAGRLAERWYARLARVFDHQLRGRQPLVLYGSHRRFEQTNVYRGLIDESTGGFTDARRRRIVLPLSRSLAETDHVLGHEIVHAFQFDIAEQHRSPLAVPLWFVEGMAEYLTLGAGDPHTAMWMRDAVAAGPLPAIRDLRSSRYFPYRWGAALWAHLARTFGDDLPGRALRAKRDVGRRLEALTGQSLDELTARWHAALREAHAAGPGRAVSATPLIASRAGGGRLNLAASLSPDGRRLVFLSERDQFSIDLYLADAADGRIVRKLITTAGSAEFESLQYLHSTGAWDPSGSRYALAAIRSGRPTLLVLGVDRDADGREVPVPGVDEIYSPTWSPDGRRIAFAAMQAGTSDLFVIDLENGELTRLTDDAFADLQPAWSPDGAVLAFTTDRFTTSLSRLEFGAYRIGFLDVATGRIEPAPALAGSQFDPAWGPRGEDLYFIGSPAGVNNVFRLRLADGAVFQVTDVDTGVSGVTRVSPVLSVAAQSGEIAFSVFRRSGYEVHTLAGAEQLAGTRVADVVLASATIPPEEGLAAVPPLPALPPALAVAVAEQQRYEPRLALEAVGAPYFSAGGGPFGSYVSAGGSLLFGDLLGDQQLLTTLYVSSRLDESAFGALYINRKARWTWGASIEQAPALRMRSRGIRADESDGEFTRERERLLWTNRHAGMFAAYPFNRSQRLEFSAGVRHLDLKRERLTEVFSMAARSMIEQEVTALPSEPAVAMAETGVAIIGDTAVFGATGPMLGQRYRLQTTANVGGLRYASVLADYRRYLMPWRPYTIAVRLLHTGRYGGDAGDFRLRDAYVGASTLVRGYSPGAVVRSECAGRSADCPALNTLLGNRLAVAKLELRVPFWSTLSSSRHIRYGRLPVDAFLFADAGASWGGEQRFGPGGSEGKVFRSAGAGVRANLLGLVLEAAAVRPFDLRHAGWSFALNLRPAF